MVFYDAEPLGTRSWGGTRAAGDALGESACRKREHTLAQRRERYQHDSDSLAPFVIAAEVPLKRALHHAATIESLAKVGSSLAVAPGA